MKKIIINASILDTKPTGVGIYTINVLNQLDSYGLKYSLYSSMPKENQNIENIIIPKYVRPYPYGKLGGILRFIINQFHFSFVAREYDIAYLLTPHGSLFLKNQIVTVHDLLALHFPEQHKLQYYYFKYFMPIILKNAKKIITVSESTKNDLIKFYNINSNKIKVIYCGIDRTFFTKKKEAKKYIKNKYNLENFIFTVGSSYPHKNINRLIEAFNKLNDKNITLAITGKVGKYQKQMIESYNIKNVTFIGYVDFNDLPYFYSAAIAMVYPSLYEGFGLPPLEAMSCDCPVIVSNTSSLPEVCGEAAEYINPTDVESIKNGIIKVVYDKEYRQSLIEKGREQVKKFSWEETVRKILKVLLDLENE